VKGPRKYELQGPFGLTGSVTHPVDAPALGASRGHVTCHGGEFPHRVRLSPSSHPASARGLWRG